VLKNIEQNQIRCIYF